MRNIIVSALAVAALQAAPVPARAGSGLGAVGGAVGGAGHGGGLFWIAVIIERILEGYLAAQVASGHNVHTPRLSEAEDPGPAEARRLASSVVLGFSF